MPGAALEGGYEYWTENVMLSWPWVLTLLYLSSPFCTTTSRKTRKGASNLKYKTKIKPNGSQALTKDQGAHVIGCCVQPIPQRWINHNRNLGPKRTKSQHSREKKPATKNAWDDEPYLQLVSYTLSKPWHTRADVWFSPHCLIKPSTAYSFCSHFTATFLTGQQWRNNLETSFFFNDGCVFKPQTSSLTIVS